MLLRLWPLWVSLSLSAKTLEVAFLFDAKCSQLGREISNRNSRAYSGLLVGTGQVGQIVLNHTQSTLFATFPVQLIVPPAFPNPQQLRGNKLTAYLIFLIFQGFMAPAVGIEPTTN